MIVRLMVEVVNLLNRRVITIMITITIKIMPTQPIIYLMFNVIKI